MKLVIVLPGIMDSRLSLNGEEIWRPTLGELASHYGRAAKLSGPAAKSTDIIRKVTDCYPVYQSLVDHLDIWGFEESAAGGYRGKAVCWHYYWRRDNRETAVRFSLYLAEAVAAGATEIAVIAHSMGGLIARYALECDDPRLGNTEWRNHCWLLASLGTPHRGAPLALVRALGLEPALGITADDVKVGGNGTTCRNKHYG